MHYIREVILGSEYMQVNNFFGNEVKLRMHSAGTVTSMSTYEQDWDHVHVERD